MREKVMTIGMWEIQKFERLIIGNSIAMIMKAYRNVWFPGKTQAIFFFFLTQATKTEQQ